MIYMTKGRTNGVRCVVDMTGCCQRAVVVKFERRSLGALESFYFIVGLMIFFHEILENKWFF